MSRPTWSSLGSLALSPTANYALPHCNAGREPHDGHLLGGGLYHSALAVRDGDHDFVIEMAPVWNTDSAQRGVVLQGPVGARWLGRSRWFRYEVRLWQDGRIPDSAEAVASPMRASNSHTQVAMLLQVLPTVPPLTWGRDELSAGEMWNSNSLVSWLLARSGHQMSTIHPPVHGRAPGWKAGLILASRQAVP